MNKSITTHAAICTYRPTSPESTVFPCVHPWTDFAEADEVLLNESSTAFLTSRRCPPVIVTTP
jgi:hypothetical protein